jgi:hypothetical protein
LRNAGNAIISTPFQQTIPILTPGKPEVLRFGVRENADVIGVEIAYADQRDVQLVRLDSDLRASLRLQPIQVSQEADIGAAAVYELDLIRSPGADPQVALRTTGLPPGFSAEFLLDPNQSSTRLVRYRFPDQEVSRRIALKIRIPQAPAPVQPMPVRNDASDDRNRENAPVEDQRLGECRRRVELIPTRRGGIACPRVFRRALWRTHAHPGDHRHEVTELTEA